MRGRTTKVCAWMTLLAGLLAPLGSEAQTVLCIPGIPGPIELEAGRDCMEVVGFGQDLTVQPALVEFSPVKVIKPVGPATPVLFVASAKQTTFEAVEIIFFQECGGSVFERYKVELLQNVVISRVSHTGGADLPTEQVEFAFDRIQWSSTIVDPTCAPEGTIERGWDLINDQEF